MANAMIEQAKEQARGQRRRGVHRPFQPSANERYIGNTTHADPSGSPSRWRCRSALSAPAGAATFHDGGDVSGSSHDAHDPQVVVNARGDAAFVWRLDDGSNDVQARTRTGNTLGRITYVSDNGSVANQPDVAIDEDGNAFIT